MAEDGVRGRGAGQVAERPGALAVRCAMELLEGAGEPRPRLGFAPAAGPPGQCLRTVLGADRLEFLGDFRQRLIPTDLLVGLRLAARPHPFHRRLEAILVVEHGRAGLPLGAEPAFGHRVVRIAVDVHNPALADMHLHAARALAERAARGYHLLGQGRGPGIAVAPGERNGLDGLGGSGHRQTGEGGGGPGYLQESPSGQFSIVHDFLQCVSSNPLPRSTTPGIARNPSHPSST